MSQDTRKAGFEDEPVWILMVDDRPENLMALEAILTRPDYRLVRASSGNEALRQLLKHDFAAILLDVMMPEMDGYELASIIREREATRHTPIVFLTAVAKDLSHVFRGYSVGAADYLTKPLDPQIVKAKVAVFVDLYRKNRRILEQEKLLRAKESAQRESELSKVKQDSERRLADLVQTVPGVVWEMTEVAGSDLPAISFVSRYVEKVLGYPSSEWTAKPSFWFDVLLASDRERVVSEVRKGLAKGGEGTLRFQWIHKNGASICIESQYTDVRGSDGKVRGIKGVALDVTERVRALEALKRAKEAAESASRMKSVFLATMSHEIRTPLGAILGFTELMRDPDSSPEEREKYLKIVVRNGQSLSHLINDILDLSKVESDHMEVEWLRQDPKEIVSDVVSTLSAKAADKGVRLEVSYSTNVPEDFVTDPMRFKQILMNLVDNAIKFTPTGIVEIAADFQADFLRVLVKDSGIGISDQEKVRLFQPFVQADGSTTRRYGGTGLGLVLSRRLARLLGGDVKLLDSTPNKGSTFELTVRNSPSNVQPGMLSRADHEQVARSDIAKELLKDRSILLVEDSSDNRQFISRILNKFGASVDCAQNGEEGVEMALQGNYDVVLMDIQMPVLDGYSATAKLRKSGFQKPIIALTAHALVENRRECLNVGCTDYLAKPVNKDELAETILRHVSSRDRASVQQSIH